MKGITKYFLGIRLPKDFEEECEAWRRKFNAPRTVAHLTVIAPFNWPHAEQALTSLLTCTLANFKAFPLVTAGLGSFGSHVIFIAVQANSILLQLHSTLKTALAESGIQMETRPYSPHITLATRLDKQRFWAYKKQLVNFRRLYSFICEDLSVFRFEKDGRWHECVKVALKADLFS